MSLDMKWYALQCLSNHEDKVKRYLVKYKEDDEEFCSSLKEILVPIETISEVKNGKKVSRYRYINNTRYKIPLYEKETHKIENENGGGLLGPIIGSGLTKLVPGNLFFSNTFDTQGTDLECRKVKMDCHFINSDNLDYLSNKFFFHQIRIVH